MYRSEIAGGNRHSPIKIFILFYFFKHNLCMESDIYKFQSVPCPHTAHRKERSDLLVSTTPVNGEGQSSSNSLILVQFLNRSPTLEFHCYFGPLLLSNLDFGKFQRTNVQLSKSFSQSLWHLIDTHESIEDTEPVFESLTNAFEFGGPALTNVSYSYIYQPLLITLDMTNV